MTAGGVRWPPGGLERKFAYRQGEWRQVVLGMKFDCEEDSTQLLIKVLM